MSDPPEGTAGTSGGAPRPDAALKLATASVAVLAVCFSLVALLAAGGRAALGVAVGGAIAVANLVVFALVVRGVLTGGTRGRMWILVGIVKIFLLFGGVWWLLDSGVASAVALIAGYGALPLGIAIGGFIAPRPAAEGSADGPGPTASATPDGAERGRGEGL